MILAGVSDACIRRQHPGDDALTLFSGRTIRFAAVLQSGNETLMHYACLEGMGFAFLPKWLVSDDLAAGRLERALPEKLFFAG
jgi:DNA-binding transcriptional LysR family regulator